MTLVTWKDLCIDAVDVDAQARFWAAVAGLVYADAESPARLTGATPRHTLWVNPVDRAPIAKNRTHLDVDCALLGELLALGARILSPSAESGLGWTVMADPEGNEFCAFERTPDRLPAYRLHGIGIDCRDPETLARWWGRLLGAEPEHDTTHDVWTMTGVAVDERMTLDFAPVPEPRTEPNRLHWDVIGDADELIEAGATRLCDQTRWVVLADPEGNEFCVFPHRQQLGAGASSETTSQIPPTGHSDTGLLPHVSCR